MSSHLVEMVEDTHSSIMSNANGAIDSSISRYTFAQNVVTGCQPVTLYVLQHLMVHRTCVPLWDHQSYDDVQFGLE
jgi:hypothetical protein